MSVHEIKLNRLYAYYKDLQDKMEELEKTVDIDESFSSDYHYQSFDDLIVQSQDNTEQEVSQSLSLEKEVMQFDDGIADDEAGETTNMDMSMSGLSTAYALKDFLSRPTSIASYTIPHGEAFNIRTINPWSEFFTHPNIMKKLDNFAYIRCNLKVKFVINSSPFIYGAYGAAYQPLQDFNDSLKPTGNYREMIMLSQRHNVVLESHKNKGGTLTLPFFYYKEWLHCQDADLQAMGRIDIWPYSSFASANGTATSPVTIRVYAWAEDVELAGATLLTVQSADEYGQGPVSATASAIAGASSYLENIPVIGKFARATTIGAKATSKIAALFGWTNVPVIEDVKPLKNQPFHAFASSEIGTPIEKLTLDPKNELTVDPTTTGHCEHDEFSVRYLCGRESYITNVLWAQSDAVFDSLMYFNVTPTWCDIDVSSGYNVIHDTPMAHVSRMFQNWRGSLVVRLKVVASPYHQGRIRVTYDPRGDIYSTNDTSNVCVTKILDLSVTDEAEFIIPYMQAQPWLRVRDTFTQDQSVTAAPGYDIDYHNGRFEVEVLTTLTGPDTASDVRILAFVRAGDDFELANPGGMPDDATPVAIQSADEIISAEGKTVYTMGEMTSRPVDLNVVHFGESIQSVRPLMRRTNFLLKRVQDFTPTANQINTIIFGANIYPHLPGYVTGGYYRAQGLVDTVTTFDVSGTINNPLTWMSYCFAGIRGSIHYHYNNISENEYPSIVASRVFTTPDKASVANRSILDEVTFGGLDNFVTGAGYALQNERTQNGVSFAVPFMNKFKFVPTSPAKLGTNGSPNYDMNKNNYEIRFKKYFSTGTPTDLVTEVYMSAGTDFSLVNFIGVPKVTDYKIASITAIAPGPI